jgi:3-oxoacyl-[acyl-carrier protein] reductase
VSRDEAEETGCDMRLSGLVAVVTGAGSGFGKGIAEAFRQAGAKVTVADLDGAAAEATAARLGSDVLAVTADVARERDVAAMIDRTVTRFGGLDVLVNNAGTTHRNTSMLDVSEEDFDRIYAVNVKSIFWTTRAAVPIMTAQGRGGSIINVASTAGLRPRPGLTWYNGSKGAVITLTKSMAAELAPLQIRVNAINPVIGETGLLETFMGVPDTPDNRARFVATIPLGRMSRPSDIANAAVFFADPASAFVTGSTIEVDGGRCI